MPKTSSKEDPKTKDFYSESSIALPDQNDKPSINVLGNNISNCAFYNSICTCKHCPIHKDLQNNNGLYILILINADIYKYFLCLL